MPVLSLGSSSHSVSQLSQSRRNVISLSAMRGLLWTLGV